MQRYLPDAKILFLSTQKPQLHKKIRAPRPPILEVWRVKGSTFPHLPPKLGGQIPSTFCMGYPRDDPPNPENFVKVSPPVSEIFGIFHFPKVSYTLITESLCSDEYSRTSRTLLLVLSPERQNLLTSLLFLNLYTGSK